MVFFSVQRRGEGEGERVERVRVDGREGEGREGSQAASADDYSNDAIDGNSLNPSGTMNKFRLGSLKIHRDSQWVFTGPEKEPM